MDKKENAITKLKTKLEKIQSNIDIFYDSLEGIWTDREYGEIIEDITGIDYSTKKLSKKAKQEKREKVLILIRKKFPTFEATFKEMDRIMDAIDFMIEEKKDRLDEIYEKLEDIEMLSDEIQEKRENINL